MHVKSLFFRRKKKRKRKRKISWKNIQTVPIKHYHIVAGITVQSKRSHITIFHQWERKLKNLEGNGEKMGLWGYPLKNSLVLAHLCTAYGQLYYLLFFIFLFFSLFFSPTFLPSRNFRGNSPSLKILAPTPFTACVFHQIYMEQDLSFKMISI